MAGSLRPNSFSAPKTLVTGFGFVVWQYFYDFRMNELRRFAAKTLRTILGRKQLSRLGRFLLNSGRMDGDNDQRFNGEFLYLRTILRAAVKKSGSATMFDIGANKGIVTKYASQILGSNGRIFAAEPCSATFKTLQSETSGLEAKIHLINAAFSDKNGTGTLQVEGPNAGTNSLVPSQTTTATESVQLYTLDSFASAHSIDSIDFIKIDTEGHDFSVINGCRELLQSKRIGCVQFEYNWRWIGQRCFLKDVFDLVSKLPPYRIGKVTCRGIEWYEKWSPELETLIENNYAVSREDLLVEMPSVKPWFN